MSEQQQQEDYDPLMAYAYWYKAQPYAIPRSPFDGVVRVDGFSGLVLHRSGRHQVQLWICDPNTTIPEHSHPNVDSFAMWVSGDLQFMVEGGDGKPTNSFRAKPGVKHSATIGPKGAAFLTFHEFTDGDPRSVTEDWSGPPLGAQHADMLRVPYGPVDAVLERTRREFAEEGHKIP